MRNHVRTLRDHGYSDADIVARLLDLPLPDRMPRTSGTAVIGRRTSPAPGE